VVGRLTGTAIWNDVKLGLTFSNAAEVQVIDKLQRGRDTAVQGLDVEEIPSVIHDVPMCMQF
jgi:hypothetical protein